MLLIENPENLIVPVVREAPCHPDLALAQYRHCEQVLAREFGTQPLRETQRLYQQILKEGDGAQVSGQGCN